MKPRDANTFDKACDLKKDNYDAGDFWILIDGSVVTIAAQKTGERASSMTSIPRSKFNKLVDWYMRDQKPSKKARK